MRVRIYSYKFIHKGRWCYIYIMTTIENFCNICLEEITGEYDKCIYCVDGAICNDCILKYCPAGFSTTDNLNECKCPVCRLVNWKWIKDEMLMCMFEEIYNDDNYHTDRKQKLYDIVINNSPDYDVEHWRRWQQEV
jgi:hypothetical protein